MTIPAEKVATYRTGLRRRLSGKSTKAEQDALDKAQTEASELAQALVKNSKPAGFGFLDRRSG